MTPALSVVSSEPLPARTETVAQRVRRLQAEAKQAVRDHTRDLSGDLLRAAETAAAIAEGGDVYPAGIRELARGLISDIEGRLQTLEAIVARVL